MTDKPLAEQIFGGNKAPLDEVLSANFVQLAKEVDALAGEVLLRPAKVRDDTDFAAVGALVGKCRLMTKRLEETRKSETDPMLVAQRGIKAFFDIMAAKIEKALSPHSEAANSYAREKVVRERREREEQAAKLREAEERERQKAESARGGVAARAEGRAEAFAAKAEALEVNVSAADAVRTKVSGGGVATATARWNFEITDYNALDLNALRPFINRDAVETAIRSLVRVQKDNTQLAGVRVFKDVQASFR